MSTRSPYDVLGVPRHANAQQIAAAYKRLSFERHPDRNGNTPAANDAARELNEAFAKLNDPARRADVDRALSCEDDACRGSHSTERVVVPPRGSPWRAWLVAIASGTMVIALDVHRRGETRRPQSPSPHTPRRGLRRRKGGS